MKTFIPIIHARIHDKILKHTRGNVVEYRIVKEWVSRIIIKKGGIPREDIQTTINDMVQMGLLSKVCRLKFKIEKIESENGKFIINKNNSIKVREPIF